MERTIDLAKPPTEPLVFDLDGNGAAPVLRFSLLLRTSARNFDATRWAGPLDTAALLDVQRTTQLALPTREVVVTFRNDAGKVLATGRAKVRAGRSKPG